VSQLEQERLQPADQRRLQVPFRDRAGNVEEVQDIGVAGQLLGQLRIRGGQLLGEVRLRRADAAVLNRPGVSGDSHG
jgi:hypothetical protein